MKSLPYVVLAILLVSCGAKTDYGKTIGEYLQTDKRGSKYDLHFKVIELNEQRKITAADSIAFLTEEFRKDQELIIDRIKFAKETSEKLLKNEESRRRPNQEYVASYKTTIEVCNHRMDSLNNLVPTNLKGYDKRSATDVLAVVVRCKYSIQPPSSNTTVEETFDFTLSPDGKRCYGKVRAK